MHMNLYKIRKERKLTQDTVSKVIGKSSKQYGKKERGQASFSLQEAESLSVFFEIPITDIFPEYFFETRVPEMHINV